MALSYIPQAQRFIIVEGLGCAIALLNSYPAIFLVYIWPVVLGTISIVYGLIAIKYFLARRLQFQTLLKSSQSGLNSGQYFRLMAMASADLIIGMPLNIAILITKAQHVDAWPGISRVYENWGYVREVSADAVDIYYNDPAGTTLSVLSGWFAPLLAFLFFIFFGVTQDAVREYSRWYPALMRRFGFAEPAQTSNFVPKLGTAIARPAGYDYWSETHSAKDLDIERGFQGMATVPSVTHGTGGSGLAVSVHVDRRIA